MYEVIDNDALNILRYYVGNCSHRSEDYYGESCNEIDEDYGYEDGRVIGILQAWDCMYIYTGYPGDRDTLRLFNLYNCTMYTPTEGEIEEMVHEFIERCTNEIYEITEEGISKLINNIKKAC